MIYPTPDGPVALRPAHIYHLNTRHGTLHLRADAVVSVFVAHDCATLLIETVVKTHHALNDACALPLRAAFGIPEPHDREPDVDPHEFGVHKFGADY